MIWIITIAGCPKVGRLQKKLSGCFLNTHPLSSIGTALWPSMAVRGASGTGRKVLAGMKGPFGRGSAGVVADRRRGPLLPA